MKNQFFSILTAALIVGISTATFTMNATEAQELKVAEHNAHNYSAGYSNSRYSNNAFSRYLQPASKHRDYRLSYNGNCANGSCGTRTGFSSCPNGNCGLLHPGGHCADGQCGLKTTPYTPARPNYNVPKYNVPSYNRYDQDRYQVPVPPRSGSRGSNSRYSNTDDLRTDAQNNDIFNAFHELESASSPRAHSANRYDFSNSRDWQRYDNSRDNHRNSRDFERVNPTRRQYEQRFELPVSFQTPATPVSNAGKSPYYE